MVMVNKTNNHLSHIKLLDTKNTTTYGIGNLDPGLEQEIYEKKRFKTVMVNKQKTTSNIKTLDMKRIMTYNIGNPDPCFEQVHLII
jgi:hypothetical protein